MKRTLLALWLMISAFVCTNAGVVLPAIFSDHMVLEQNTRVKIWGWAKPKEMITITPSWGGEVVKARPGSDASWSAEIVTPKAGGPYEITVKGYNEVTIHDVMIGEVWVCSGQSNMEWSVGAGFEGSDEVVAKASKPELRFFNVDYRTSATPTHDVSGRWVVCSPETVGVCSAIGYFIGEQMNASLGCPVGIINSSWGGTAIESWIESTPFEMCDYLRKQNELLNEHEWGPVRPSLIYNAMLAPLGGYKASGVAWYQGEANVDNHESYTDMMFPLVEGFRRLFGEDIPFVFAQIAPYNYGENTKGVEIQNRQRLSLQIPGTAMVCLNDIGNPQDIHPRKKREAGLRFADAVLHIAYGKTERPLMGPIFKSMEVIKNKAIITFDYADGLKCEGKTLTWFEISADGETFVPAKAVIKNGKVEVSAKGIKIPKHVRFAWSNIAEPNLFNGAGLPASCFTTKE